MLTSLVRSLPRQLSHGFYEAGHMMYPGGEVMPTIDRPDPSEYGAYYRKYVDLVPGGNILEILLDQIEPTLALVGLREEETVARYAPGKWNTREILGHLIDTERIFAYRALRIARGDKTPLPGFEQDDYVKAAGFSDRMFASLLDEFHVVRQGTVALFKGLPAEAVTRTGTANDNPVSVRAIAWIVAGHERHHMKIVRENYVK